MIKEAITDYIGVIDTFDTRNAKIDAYIESAMMQLDINRSESELKVLQESGTQDDLNYLYTEAEGGALTQLKNALKAILKNFIEFIKNLKTKVVRLVTNQGTDAVLKKVQKKLKFNPFLSKKKVKVIDKRKPLKVIAEYKSKADKAIARVASGVFKEKQITSIHQDIDSFEGAYKAAVAGTAACVTTTVAKLITDLRAEVSALPDHIDKVDKETSAVVEKLISSLDKEEATAVRAAFTTCANFRTKLGQKEASEHLDAIMDKLRVLRRDVLKAADGKTPSTPMKESYDDFDDDYDEEFEESSEDLFDGFLEESAFSQDIDEGYTADDLLNELSNFEESLYD